MFYIYVKRVMFLYVFLFLYCIFLFTKKSQQKDRLCPR